MQLPPIHVSAATTRGAAGLGVVAMVAVGISLGSGHQADADVPGVTTQSGQPTAVFDVQDPRALSRPPGRR